MKKLQLKFMYLVTRFMGKCVMYGFTTWVDQEKYLDELVSLGDDLEKELGK